MLAIRLTIEDHRLRPMTRHVIELHLPDDGRVKQYDVLVDGKAWARMGLARVLAAIRRRLRPTGRYDEVTT